MKRWMIGLAALALAAATPTAWAFPPTATVSPGYDRALAESRRAHEAAPPVVAEPVPRADRKLRQSKRFGKTH